MKMYIVPFLAISLISFKSIAGYMSKTELESCSSGRTFYSQKSHCELQKGESCYKIPQDYDCQYSRKKDSKSEVEICFNDADCQSKLEAKVCTDKSESAVKVTDTDPKEVYCTRPFVGEDASLKSAYEAQKASDDAYEAGIQQALKSARCGDRVKALLLVRNASKGLTNGQKKQLVQDHKDTISLLDAGSLDAAKAEILATVADGTIITEDDKTALVAELDSCKP